MIFTRFLSTVICAASLMGTLVPSISASPIAAHDHSTKALTAGQQAVIDNVHNTLTDLRGKISEISQSHADLIARPAIGNDGNDGAQQDPFAAVTSAINQAISAATSQLTSIFGQGQGQHFDPYPFVTCTFRGTCIQVVHELEHVIQEITHLIISSHTGGHGNDANFFGLLQPVDNELAGFLQIITTQIGLAALFPVATGFEIMMNNLALLGFVLTKAALHI
ncbi:hypothetical protein D9758_013186 [Tetrapyrgos nigripes]|uniref:Uncharacterized protein n=1 Tax=Tetrapyrgos nigripes TaxID=182062 RepID=A0A8H5CTA3_9AGAR|nr:hypothetical protein D9758_013186 [Tetrapyrgos nigripes]